MVLDQEELTNTEDTRGDSMCEFISDYDYNKLFKRTMDRLAEEEEEQQPELEKVEEQPLVASK
jgi:hypothetical protein